MGTLEQHPTDEYYPADLQEQAKEAYSKLPESGTVAQLVDRIVAELSTYVAADAYVQVGWKNDILTEPLGQETREVINVGTMQWFWENPNRVIVCPNGGYISRENGSSAWLTISDEEAEHYRELRWKIVNLRQKS